MRSSAAHSGPVLEPQTVGIGRGLWHHYSIAVEQKGLGTSRRGDPVDHGLHLLHSLGNVLDLEALLDR